MLFPTSSEAQKIVYVSCPSSWSNFEMRNTAFSDRLLSERLIVWLTFLATVCIQPMQGLVAKALRTRTMC